MQIGRKDLFWNYTATSMRILSGIIVLPVSLRMLSSEEMGIWSIFLSLITITSLLDFGFSNSFSRNVSYIYSGVKELKTKGYAAAEAAEVDYGLLKSLLSAMKRYYAIVALVFLLLFIAGGTFYMSSILENYSGNNQTIWISWFIFGVTLAYELYTYYYNSILTGRGLIKKNMQIIVFSQSIRIIVTLVFLFFGFGIISLVLGLLISDVINRILAYKVFYDKETKQNLATSVASSSLNTIKTLLPNSLKIGTILLSMFLRSKAIVLIAPFFLSLSVIAEYGISTMFINLISSLGSAWFQTFYPKLSQYSVHEKQNDRKRIYIKGTTILLLTFIILGALLILLGNHILVFIHSKTLMLSGWYLFLMLLFAFLEQNQTMSLQFFIAKNEVIFFKANIFTGIAAIILLILMLNYTSWGVLSLILCTGLAMSVFLNWKLPYMVAKELQLSFKDYICTIKDFWAENKKTVFSRG
jgi:O-antigen/teichoic acid export membrane protein